MPCEVDATVAIAAMICLGVSLGGVVALILAHLELRGQVHELRQWKRERDVERYRRSDSQ